MDIAIEDAPSDLLDKLRAIDENPKSVSFFEHLPISRRRLVPGLIVCAAAALAGALAAIPNPTRIAGLEALAGLGVGASGALGLWMGHKRRQERLGMKPFRAVNGLYLFTVDIDKISYHKLWKLKDVRHLDTQADGRRKVELDFEGYTLRDLILWNNQGVRLFDEIEKARREIRLLVQAQRLKTLTSEDIFGELFA